MKRYLAIPVMLSLILTACATNGASSKLKVCPDTLNCSVQELDESVRQSPPIPDDSHRPISSFIIQPIKSHPWVDAKGHLLPAFIADLEKIAGVKIIYDPSKVYYDKEAGLNSFALEFATPIAPPQANAIFSAWRSKGLVEYAENNGRVFPT